MRHVYIFRNEKTEIEAVQALTKELDKGYRASKIEYLSGVDAYQFLLIWMLGGFNPKLRFIDCRVSGEVHKLWTGILRNAKHSVKHRQYKEDYNELVDVFFRDVRGLWRIIATFSDKESRQEDIANATLRLGELRSQGALKHIGKLDYRILFAEEPGFKNGVMKSLLDVNSNYHRALSKAKANPFSFKDSTYAPHIFQRYQYNKKQMARLIAEEATTLRAIKL